MTPIQIKICGVTNANDARACVELGADMIGFNFYPASPRYIEPTVVRGIVDTLPARTCAVGVFVDADRAEIRKLAKTAGVRAVQLHGHATPESCNELAREFRVIRALSTDTRFEPEHIAAFPRMRCTHRCVPPRAQRRHGSDVRLVRCAGRNALHPVPDSLRWFRRAKCLSSDRGGDAPRGRRL